MRPQEIIELLHRKPFGPLRLHMTDGETYDIYHPDLVIVLRQRIDIGVSSKKVPGMAERVDHCSLLHVVRTEELESASPSAGAESGNGKES